MYIKCMIQTYISWKDLDVLVFTSEDAKQRCFETSQ